MGTAIRGARAAVRRHPRPRHRRPPRTGAASNAPAPPTVAAAGECSPVRRDDFWTLDPETNRGRRVSAGPVRLPRGCPLADEDRAGPDRVRALGQLDPVHARPETVAAQPRLAARGRTHRLHRTAGYVDELERCRSAARQGEG